MAVRGGKPDAKRRDARDSIADKIVTRQQVEQFGEKRQSSLAR